jgi:hypothetical protein
MRGLGERREQELLEAQKTLVISIRSGQLGLKTDRQPVTLPLSPTPLFQHGKREIPPT